MFKAGDRVRYARTDGLLEYAAEKRGYTIKPGALGTVVRQGGPFVLVTLDNFPHKVEDGGWAFDAVSLEYEDVPSQQEQPTSEPRCIVRWTGTYPDGSSHKVLEFPTMLEALTQTLLAAQAVRVLVGHGNYQSGTKMTFEVVEV